MKYTLKTFADEHNLKKHTVYARLKKLERKHPELSLTEKDGNKFYLTNTGVALLIQNIEENPILNNVSDSVDYEQIRIAPEKTQTQNNNADTTADYLALNKEIEALKSANNTLNAENKSLLEQLANKDKQIEELHAIINNHVKLNTEMIATFKQSLNESHYLALEKQNSKQIEPPPEIQPQSKKKKKKKAKKNKSKKSGFVGIKR